jgi:hypothetical protein
MLPYVFIGSSSEAAEHVASAVQAELARAANVQIWNQDFFPPGSYVLDTLAEKADRFDFAIFIFAADDVVESRGKRYLAARDNTVLEAGFFLAHLGRKRTFIVAPNEPDLKLPSDLHGLTRIPYPHQLSMDLIRAEMGPACTQMRNSIRELGKRNSIESKLSDGMITVLGLIEARSSVSPPDLGELLARFNRGNKTDRQAWGKAAQYLILYLEQAGLIEHTVLTSMTLKLSKAGIELARSEAFKRKLNEILVTDRGALVRALFSRQ